jgi:hypothetical protein
MYACDRWRRGKGEELRKRRSETGGDRRAGTHAKGMGKKKKKRQRVMDEREVRTARQASMCL